LTNEEEEEPVKKRMASNSMIKNRGSTPHRNKAIKNPRVKHRRKFEKATHRLKGMKPSHSNLKSRYYGEKTGINMNVKRSISLH
jgi:U3 small nucleolar RNA-associated protein 3